MHATAGDLAEYAPAVLAHPEAARGLEQALIEAMIHCEGDKDRAAQRKHAAIMRRFHRVVENYLEEPLYVQEMCKEVGTSLRTLNACCHEHLGMGPKHYLLLRRMHVVRRALRQSGTADTTVTEVSTRYGFGNLAASRSNTKRCSEKRHPSRWRGRRVEPRGEFHGRRISAEIA